MQSGNVSFLIGSGASYPAIPIAGNIEAELNKLFKTDKPAFESKRLEFLSTIQTATNALFEVAKIANVEEALKQYQSFLDIVSRLLEARRTPLLSKQATIFSTNYDMFVERASEGLPTLRLNDGFQRTPGITGSFHFRPETFFDVTHATGNLFNYEFAMPGVNLVKLHGSVSWLIESAALVSRSSKCSIPDKKSATYTKEINVFLNQFALILPTFAKFEQTLMERVYYDLLRIYANRLELENSLLIAFGFSFEDEHLLDITRRALKNPTLILVISAHTSAAVAKYEEKFGKFSNVVILYPEDGQTIAFEQFNSMLSTVIPKSIYED
jgi:hypothetical protein